MLLRALLLSVILVGQAFAANPNVRVTQRYAPFGSQPDAVSDVPEFMYFGTTFSHNDAIYANLGVKAGSDGHLYTGMLCDDITYTFDGIPPYFTQGYVNTVQVETGNLKTSVTPFHAAAVMAFFDSTGANGGPGNLLYREGYIGTFTQAGYYYFGVTWIHYVPPLFMLHTPGQMIWGCVFFDNLGDPSVDTAALNNLGLVINGNTQRSGSSQDLFFVGSVPEDTSCPASFPAGSQISSPNSLPYTANFVLDEDVYDLDTLFLDGFDYGVCDIPYFGP